MRKFVSGLITPAAVSTGFFYVGNFLLNVGNYAFHFLLLRWLSPSGYGEFSSYLSLVYLLTIPSLALSTWVTSRVAGMYGSNDLKMANRFFYFLLRKLGWPSLWFAVSLLGLLPILGWVLHIDRLALVVLGISIVTSLLGAVLSAYVIGFQMLFAYVMVGMLGILGKIGVTYWLIVQMGWGAAGGVMGILVAGLMGVVGMWWIIRRWLTPVDKGYESTFVLRSLVTYPVVFSAGSLSLISLDVLLVRYFFSSESSGLYASIATISKMIYFGLMPLSVVMLSVVSHRFAQGLSVQRVFWKLLGTISAMGLVGVVVFSFGAPMVVRVLSGEPYVSASRLLPYLSVSMFLMAVNVTLVNYFMAVGKMRVNLILLVAVIAQPLLISVFHQRLLDVAWINVGVQGGLLVGLIGYYGRA